VPRNAVSDGRGVDTLESTHETMNVAVLTAVVVSGRLMYAKTSAKGRSPDSSSDCEEEWRLWTSGLQSGLRSGPTGPQPAGEVRAHGVLALEMDLVQRRDLGILVREDACEMGCGLQRWLAKDTT
jgi:hypothetical protein